MAYVETKFQAQFAARLIDNIQAILERDTELALRDIDETLDPFKEFRLPTQITTKFPALFLSPSGVKPKQSPDDSFIEYQAEFQVDIAIVGRDSFDLTRHITRYVLAVDRVLRSATNDELTGGVTPYVGPAEWEVTDHGYSNLREIEEGSIYRMYARVIFTIQLIER